jgi:hypothetical protein
MSIEQNVILLSEGYILVTATNILLKSIFNRFAYIKGSIWESICTHHSNIYILIRT